MFDRLRNVYRLILSSFYFRDNKARAMNLLFYIYSDSIISIAQGVG
jgi:hypothetical protein